MYAPSVVWSPDTCYCPVAAGGGGIPAIAASWGGPREKGWGEELSLLAGSSAQVAEGWEQVQTGDHAAALRTCPHPRWELEAEVDLLLRPFRQWLDPFPAGLCP